MSAPDYLADDALDLLDFPAIRAALAAHVRYGPARPLALALAPSFDPQAVAALADETAQGRRLLDEIGDLDLTLATDPSEAVRRAALEGLLTGEELLSVADAIVVQARAGGLNSATHSVPGGGSGRAGVSAPILTAMASRIPDLTDVEQAIRRSISDRGEVLDGATPTLRGLRAHVRQAYEDVTSALGRILRSDLSSALQEQVVSMRGDRFVLQVRSELRHKVPGIVHDASNTGATVYVEPLATVDLGNSWRELALEEERETARVLAELSARVGAAGDAFVFGSELTGAIDLILARARHGIRSKGVTPTLPDESRSAAGPLLRLVAASHPLLGEAAVPLTINLGAREAGSNGEWSVLVVTGPNTGGKTVAMKIVGLLVAMNQAGLQVPATEAMLPVFDGLYVDVGDHQSIEGSVSTFSSHMRRVIGILGRAGSGSLVLLDELGASTDPEEGAALARAVLDRLAEQKIPTVVTTHHRSVAAHAEASKGMENASVDLDPDTLAPTYRLTMGVPGRSYGMSVAAGLGMPEDVLAAAGSYIDAKSAHYEESIEQLRRERAAVERALTSAEAATQSAERARVELEAERATFNARRGDLVEAMHGELVAKFDDLTSRLKRAEAALSWNIGNVEAADSVDRSVVESVTEDLATAKREISDLEREELPQIEPATLATSPVHKAVEKGAVVEVRGLGAKGTVQSIDTGTGEAEVLMGSVRLRLELGRLIPTGSTDEPELPKVSASLGPALGTTELDLRGMRAEAAQLEVDLFLDHAIRDGMSSVRIIHGRATGVLRRVVREQLERHSLVKNYAAEDPDRGGDGATRVDLV